jgi:hypothetical protein
MENDGNTDRLEGRIVQVIERIRKSRSRPCFQNILEFLNRGSTDILEMNELKQICNEMIQRNIIYKKSRRGKESFYVFDTAKETAINESLTTETLSTGDNIDLDKLGETEIHVNEQFHNNLINIIKQEVKNEFKLLNDNVLSDISAHTVKLNKHEFTANDSKVIREDNKILIDSLNSEIQFLRNEMASKDRIIEMLIKDRDSQFNRSIENKTNDTTNNVFQYPSKSNTNKQHANKHDDRSIQLSNRFDALNNEESLTANSGDQHNVNNIKKNRTTTIVGDSMIKEIKAHKMKIDLDPDDRIYIKSFPGATIQCMRDYVKPTLRHNPDLIIVHAGTNDLKSEQTSEEIALNLLNLVKEIKTTTNEVMISSVTTRKDKQNAKGKKVNVHLKSLCSKNSIGYIDNNLITEKHLNGSGIHLNYNGTALLANNFINSIKL